MGKAEIVSNIGSGQYSAKLLLDRSKVDDRIGKIDSQISQLSTEINSMEDGPDKNFVILKRTQYEKQKEYLENTPDDPTVSIWCADFTEDLTGEVGSIEIPGERNILVIQPGDNDNAEYNPVRDGTLQSSMASTPSGVFWNLAILPGWQKWKPTYRQGVISNLSGDTADVTLTDIASTQQGLPINQSNTLSNVEIDYMNCNGGAFEDGDTVVIKFTDQDFTKPKIIGFTSNPKACQYYIRVSINNFPIENDETRGVYVKNADGDMEYGSAIDEDKTIFGPYSEVFNPVDCYITMGAWNTPYYYDDPLGNMEIQATMYLSCDPSTCDTYGYYGNRTRIRNYIGTSPPDTKRVRKVSRLKGILSDFSETPYPGISVIYKTAFIQKCIHESGRQYHKYRGAPYCDFEGTSHYDFPNVAMVYSVECTCWAGSSGWCGGHWYPYPFFAQGAGPWDVTYDNVAITVDNVDGDNPSFPGAHVEKKLNIYQGTIYTGYQTPNDTFDFSLIDLPESFI